MEARARMGREITGDHEVMKLATISKVAFFCFLWVLTALAPMVFSIDKRLQKVEEQLKP